MSIIKYLVTSVCQLGILTYSCQKETNSKINLFEIICNTDSNTGATAGFNPDRVVPTHFRMETDYKPFMIDQDVKNLALHMMVTASDKPAIGELEQLTDDITTSTEFNCVGVLGWVQINLEESVSIHAIVVWHYYKNSDIMDDVIVSVSNDSLFLHNVTILFNNDHDNSAGMGTGKDYAYTSNPCGKIIDARNENGIGTQGKFIRVFTGNKRDDVFPKYIEIAVYGKMEN